MLWGIQIFQWLVNWIFATHKLIVEVARKYEEDVIGLVTCRRNYY